MPLKKHGSQASQQPSQYESDYLPPLNKIIVDDDYDDGTSPLFTVANELEDDSELVQIITSTDSRSSHDAHGPASQRYSTQLRWSISESSKPSQSSVDFYAKRSERHSQLVRRSSLASELTQDEVIRSLVSSQCAPSVPAQSIPKLAQGAHTQQRHSLRYPSIGSLELKEFLATELSEIGQEEKSTDERKQGEKKKNKKTAS